GQPVVVGQGECAEGAAYRSPAGQPQRGRDGRGRAAGDLVAADRPHERRTDAPRLVAARRPLPAHGRGRATWAAAGRAGGSGGTGGGGTRALVARATALTGLARARATPRSSASSSYGRSSPAAMM